MIDILLEALFGLFGLIIDNIDMSWFGFANFFAFMIAIFAVVVYVQL